MLRWPVLPRYDRPDSAPLPPRRAAAFWSLGCPPHTLVHTYPCTRRTIPAAGTAAYPHTCVRAALHAAAPRVAEDPMIPSLRLAHRPALATERLRAAASPVRRRLLRPGPPVHAHACTPPDARDVRTLPTPIPILATLSAAYPRVLRITAPPPHPRRPRTAHTAPIPLAVPLAPVHAHAGTPSGRAHDVRTLPLTDPAAHLCSPAPAAPPARRTAQTCAGRHAPGALDEGSTAPSSRLAHRPAQPARVLRRAFELVCRPPRAACEPRTPARPPAICASRGHGSASHTPHNPCLARNRQTIPGGAFLSRGSGPGCIKYDSRRRRARTARCPQPLRAAAAGSARVVGWLDAPRTYATRRRGPGDCALSGTG
ncbi:hypothetical protein HYPSUDRAFT_204823 [Hypholoma sublateritium FD-334 SS-4]|uniref:Uncharacterized protein n=1 Tax=Hypholoma sublateritium (strain FD-334 SS-4) TaxID=945553 RepID=A0A0D2PG50_HYPSF|nr:hypothetical protein HYPSUDRAFT_204823 [Hypholoma sublateritium FD-334 SS-4]